MDSSSPNPIVDIANVLSPHSFWNKFLRVLWGIVWAVAFRPTPKVLHSWRRFLLRLFGAKIGKKTHVYPSVRVWAPWNLDLGDYSTISHHVDCYCVSKIVIGMHVTVSQYSYLCTASHDFMQPQMPLTTAPILIEDGAWITACVFIGPGVVVGSGAVIGACSAVFNSIPAWTVVGGNPCLHIKDRQLQSSATHGSNEDRNS